MSEYLWNEKNNKFTWLSSLYNPFKRANMPLHIFSSAIWRWINEISKVCYKGTQKNGNKYVFSENSCENFFFKFPEQHSHEIAFLNKIAGYLTLTGNVFLQLVVSGK